MGRLRAYRVALGGALAALALPVCAQEAGDDPAARLASLTLAHFTEACGEVIADPEAWLAAATEAGLHTDRSDDERVLLVLDEQELVRTEVHFYGMPAGLQTSCAVTGRDMAGFAELAAKYAISDPGFVQYGRELAAGLEAAMDEADVLFVGGELSEPADPGLPVDEVVMPHYRAIVELAGAPRYATIHIAGGAIFIDTFFREAEVTE